MTVRGCALIMAACMGSAAAAFEVDRSVMAEAYWSVWNDEAQAKIDADIERFRKADASIEVAAPDGTEVRVEQTRHAFFFGAHIFNFNQLGSKERNERYKDLYDSERGLFNSATVAFYWRTLERLPRAPRFEERFEDTEAYWNVCREPWKEPHWRRPAVDPVVNFLKAKGCRIHGHPLVWGNNDWMTPTWLWDDFCPESEKAALEAASGVKVPRWNGKSTLGVITPGADAAWRKSWDEIYKRLSVEEIARLVPTYLDAVGTFYETRVRDIAERYGSRVDSWDVVNESATDYERFGRKAVRGKAFDESWYGPMPADYAYKAFAWAAKYLPKTAWLNLNDYNMGDGFFLQAKDLADHGARIDVVGSQMHLFNPKESANIAEGRMPEHLTPAGVEKRFARVSKAGRPIHLSEITITAPDNSEKGQMIQAVIARNMYRAWFAVEKMNGITWWNVVDNCGAPGEPSISGLFTRDMKAKTAYYALDDLINREWKTKTTVKAEGGRVLFRGFRGRYRLSWKGEGGKVASKIAEVR